MSQMLESSYCHSIQHGSVVSTIALEGDVTEYVARSNMQGLLVKGVPASITHIAKCSEMWAGKQWTVAYYYKNELYVKFTDQQKARNREEWEWVEVAVTSAKNVISAKILL